MASAFECIRAVRVRDERPGAPAAGYARVRSAQGFYPGGLTPYGFLVSCPPRCAPERSRGTSSRSSRASAEILLHDATPSASTGSGALKIAGGACSRTRLSTAEAGTSGARVPSSRLSSCQSACAQSCAGRARSRQASYAGPMDSRYPRRPSSTLRDVRAREGARREVAASTERPWRVLPKPRPRPGLSALRALRVEPPARDLGQLARRHVLVRRRLMKWMRWRSSRSVTGGERTATMPVRQPE